MWFNLIIKINWHLRRSFKLLSGTHQGCYLSPSLFAIFIETLPPTIRQNKKLKIITKVEEEHKSGHFVDYIITYLQKLNVTFPKLISVFENMGIRGSGSLLWSLRFPAPASVTCVLLPSPGVCDHPLVSVPTYCSSLCLRISPWIVLSRLSWSVSAPLVIASFHNVSFVATSD